MDGKAEAVMDAGHLRKRIAFDKRAETDDGYGNPVSGDWQEQFVLSARVRPLKGSEAVLAARLEGRQPVVITVRVSRHSERIDPSWRARDADAGTVYALTAPPANMDEGRAFFDILATTGEAA